MTRARPVDGASEVLVVAEEGRGRRLDQFVQRALASSADAPTRGEVQRWIQAGGVQVNGELARARVSEKLRPGDVVRVTRAAPRTTRAVPEEGIAFEVVYEDAALVVVNKPAGLVVHPASGHPGGTLVNGLLARGTFATLDAGADVESHTRPGIVHRIDKGTSGLLVVARTAAAREHLKKQLAAHTVLREYEAIAVGAVTLLEHDTLHGRHPTDRLRFTSRLREGKRAVTRVRVCARFRHATHIVCTLETGRTHQIRVHLAESGTPILGDALYGGVPREGALAEVARTLGHQALHARLLGFVHPVTGESMRFLVPAPDDFAAALRGVSV